MTQTEMQSEAYMEEGLNPDERRKLAVLLDDIARLRGSLCPGCGEPLSAHQAVIAVVMGFKVGARCSDCIAVGLDRRHEEFVKHARRHIAERPCFNAAWRRADELEGRAWVEDWPPRTKPKESTTMDKPPQHNVEWNAGDMGCGDLVLELRLRLREMAPGAVLKICAVDPGAPEDLPAWCNLTGHTLLGFQHPDYWIKRKES